MIPILIQLQPLDRETNLRTNIYVGSAAEPEALGLNATTWEPAISRRPRIAQDLASFELDGRFKLATADFIISLGMSTIQRPERLIWGGAPVTIWRVEDLAWDRRKIEFSGIVRNAPFDVNSGRLTMNCMVDRTRVEKPLLTLEFTGAGGLFGDSGMRGQVKPAGFGVNEACQAIWFDATYNIGMLDGYGNLVSVQNAIEGLDDRGAAVANYANYAALKAAIIAKTVKPGQWATAIADGLVGLGAPPADGLEWKFHATFGTTLPGAMMRRWIETHAGVPVGEVDIASFAALDAAVPREVRCHFTTQQTVDDLVEQMCLACNASPLITVQNKFAVTRAVAGAPVATLNRNRSQLPRVMDWRVAEPFDPVWKIVMRGERPASVTERDAVLYTDDIIPMGLYSATETYRDGMTVYATDGSEWLYIFATPTIGSPLPTWPATSNTWWQQLQPRVPLNGSMIGVADGAGTTVNLTSIGPQAVAFAGNSFSRTAGSGTFDACVRGDPMQGPQFVEMDIAVTTNLAVINIDDDATSYNQSAMLVNFYYRSSDGLWSLNYQNVSMGGGNTTAGLTGKLRITYDGIRFRAFVNQTQLGPDIQATATNLILWPKWHAYNGPNIVFTGLRAQPFTSNIWAEEGGPGRPSDNAGTTLTLVPVSSANIEVVGNSVRRSSGTGNWTAGVNSADSMLAGAFLSWRHVTGAGSYFVGLNDVPITNAANNFNQMDYGVYCPAGSGMTVYINGTDQVLGLAAAAAGDVFTVGYDNLTIRLWKTTAAGVTTLLHTYATTAGRRFLACATIFDLNAVAVFPITAMRFEPWTNQNWADIGGPGLPANNATADLVLTGIGTAANVIVGNTYKKTNLGGAHTGGAAASSPIIGAQFVETDILTGSVNCQVALDDNATDYVAGTNLLAYGNYNPATGGYSFGSNGSISTGSTTAGLTGRVRLEYDGLFFRLYIGGNLVGTPFAASAPDLKLWAKWPVYDANVLFTGAAAGPMTNNAWSQTGGPLRPADNAGTTLSFVANGAQAGDILIQGNRITRTVTTGGVGWNAGAYTNEIFPGAIRASARVIMIAASEAVFGIDPAPGAGANYLDPDYSFLVSSGNLYTINSPAGTTTNHGAIVAIGDMLTITYDGLNIRWYRTTVAGATTLLRTDAVAANLTFKVQVCIAYVGQGFSDIQAQPYTQNNWDVIDGTGRPSDWAGTSVTWGSNAISRIKVLGNKLTKIGGTSGSWDTRVYSLEPQMNAGSWQFKMLASSDPNQVMMCGLVENPTSWSIPYDNIIGIYSMLSSAGVTGWDNSTWLAGWVPGPAVTVANLATDVWTFEYDGNTIRIWQNSTLRGTKTVGPGKTYYLIYVPYLFQATMFDVLVGNGPDRYLDSLADGTNYGRTLQTELTGGLLRLTQAGGGRRLGDVRNMPNIAAMHLGFTFSGTISYTSTTTTATISITAGTVTSGSVNINYGALSKGITGTAGTTVRHYLFVDDPTNAGGSPSLQSTTSFASWMGGNGYVNLGYVDVVFPSSGTGGGGGAGGTGCVWLDAWVETRDRGWVQAREIRPSDFVKALALGAEGFDWVEVEAVEHTFEECYRVTAANGFEVTISWSTPITLRDGTVTDVFHIPGHELPVDVGRLDWSVCTIEHVGLRGVAKIRCHQRTYSAGDIAGRGILTHNPKP